MSEVDSVTAKIGADISGFVSAMRQVSAEADKSLSGVAQEFSALGSKISGFGTALSVGVTAPLVALGYKAVSEFREAETAITRVTIGLNATGGAAGFTASQLADMASELKEISGFDDDQILSEVTVSMLKFGTVTGKVFEEAQKVIVDYSAQTGMSLGSAAQQVGRALESPTNGMLMLRRAGIIFNETQQETIKNLEYTGQHAKAQAIILEKLRGKFDGAAAAMKKTTDGKIRSAMVEIGDALQEIGAILAEQIAPAAVKVKELAKAFQELDEGTKRGVVGIGAIAAALGPVTLGVGKLTAVWGKLTAMWGSLTAAAGTVTAPMTAMALAIGSVIAILWQFRDIIVAINKITFGPLIASLKEFSGYVVRDFKKVASDFIYVKDAIRDFSKDSAAKIEGWAKKHGLLKDTDPIKKTAQAMDALGSSSKSAGKGMEAFSKSVAPVSQQTLDVRKRIEELQFATLTLDDNFRGMTAGAPAMLKEFKLLDKGTEDLTKDAKALNAAFEKYTGAQITKEQRTNLEIYNSEIKRLNTLYSHGAIDLETYNRATKKLGKATKDNLADVSPLAAMVTDNFASAFSNVVMGTATMKDAFKSMVDSILAELARLAASKLLTGLFSLILPGSNLFGGADLFGGIFSAKGNVFSSWNLVPFAAGGVFSSPAAFPLSGGKTGVLGERGPEAIFPLTRDGNGDLGVKVSRNNTPSPTTHVYQLNQKPVFSFASPSEVRRANVAFKTMSKRSGI